MASLQDTTSTAGRLIAADQVQGTTIYNPNGDNLGSVEDVMIDKVTGKVASALSSMMPNGAMPLSDLVDFWASAIATIRCRGRSCHTTLLWAVTSSISTAAYWKVHRPTRITMRWPGTIGPGTSRSMTITARAHTGTSCRNELSCPGRDSAAFCRYHDPAGGA